MAANNKTVMAGVVALGGDAALAQFRRHALRDAALSIKKMDAAVAADDRGHAAPFIEGHRRHLRGRNGQRYISRLVHRGTAKQGQDLGEDESEDAEYRDDDGNATGLDDPGHRPVNKQGQRRSAETVGHGKGCRLSVVGRRSSVVGRRSSVVGRRS